MTDQGGDQVIMLHTTYHGHVTSLQAALTLIEACRLNELPEMTRRLSEEEMSNLIRHGGIFVFEEKICKMSLIHWSDHLNWGQPYIEGGFIYQDETHVPSERHGLTRQMLSVHSPSTFETFHLVAFFSKNIESNLKKVETDSKFKSLNLKIKSDPKFYQSLDMSTLIPHLSEIKSSNLHPQLITSNSFTTSLASSPSSSQASLTNTPQPGSSRGTITGSKGRRKRGRVATTQDDIYAPTEPRNYVRESITSKKSVPAFAKKIVKEALKSGQELPSEELDELVADSIERKRRQNTISARKSRAARAEHVRNLEETVARLIESEKNLLARNRRLEELIEGRGGIGLDEMDREDIDVGMDIGMMDVDGDMRPIKNERGRRIGEKGVEEEMLEGRMREEADKKWQARIEQVDKNWRDSYEKLERRCQGLVSQIEGLEFTLQEKERERG